MRGEEPSVEEAVAVAMASLHNPEEEVAWDDVKDFKDAEAIVIKLTTKYCNEFAPTRHYVAIETRCAALDIRTDYGVVRTTGTIDRVRELPDLRRGVTDLKSGKQATEKNDDGTRRAAIGAHHLQVGIYTLMAEVALNEQLEAPAEIVGLSTTKEAPIAAADIPDVKTALLGKEGYVGMIEMAAKTLKDGLFRPNPGAFTCTKTWCAGYPRCPYHA
ncbi:hypothetical protein RR42_m1382 [Cupriavidus basilensis]|uniref:PD-(D/E)XK endonuclease-like domain-containing protein n=1 Tax=Cupriavidus basilensis TaxID=68895 RepID=A0A0C4Y987_9BURK|nr:hypothetical protein RR42_m1382 [Cupriavidus basilensis]